MRKRDKTMGDINKIESIQDLNKRLVTIGLEFEKKRKIYKFIYLSLVFIAAIGLSIISIIIFKDYNPEIITSATTVSVIIIFLVCYYTSDLVVCNFLKSLKAMQLELDELNCEIYPDIFAKSEKNKPIKDSNLSDKLKMILGVSLLIFGCLTLIINFIIGSIISTEMFLAFLIISIWIVVYSAFLLLSKKIIRSLYYPTVSMTLIAAPPLLVAALTQQAEGWIMGIFICVATIFGLALFSLFMYLSVYRPGKERRRFIRENNELFRELESEEDGIMTEIINMKKDRAKISVWRNTRHHLIIEKMIGEEPLLFEKLNEFEFVEYQDAYYTAVKEMVDLYKAEDGRTESPFEQKLPNFDANKIYEILNQHEYLKDKVLLHNEWICIEFHKYLKIEMGDDYCEYFNTHWHPYDEEAALEFIDDLVNEKIIFYQNRRTRHNKQYPGFYLDKLLKTRDKKFCRIFSATKIYVDK